MGREPNLTELGVFTVMWSEHCSYKSSRTWLRRLPTKGPRVIHGPGENAGVVDIGDGEAADLQDGEPQPSHASSSPTRARRPASAASCATSSPWARGRSPTSTRCASAAPIIRATRHLVAGVVARHRRLRQLRRRADGRRRSQFPPRLRRQHPGQRDDRRHRATRPDLLLGAPRAPGNPVVYVGAKTGRDGIHGATMASAEFGADARGEAPDRAGRRSVHREAADRGLPGADGDRRDRRHPGHGRGGPDLVVGRDGRQGRRRHRARPRPGAARARPA